MRRGELRVHYQAQIDLRKRAPVAYEALEPYFAATVILFVALVVVRRRMAAGGGDQ